MATVSPVPKEENLAIVFSRRFLVQNFARLIVICLWAFLLWYMKRFIPTNLVEGFFFFLGYLLMIYGLWNYSLQTISEFWLLISVIRLHKGIQARMMSEKGPTKTQLQGRHDAVRINMGLYIARSNSLFSPIGDVLSQKLRRSVDTFFYGAALVVLSEKPDYYSSSEKQRAWLERQDIEARLKKLAEGITQDVEAIIKGSVREFTLYELKTFLDYLGNRIFRKNGYHAFWKMKYPINLIDYTNFFDHWNELLLRSENGKNEMERAKKEVEQYYKENRRRQDVKNERIWYLLSGLLVAVLSAFLGYVLGSR